MNWLADPVVWGLLLPALVASGLLMQMILGLFTCCGTFRLRGRSVSLRWWSIPLGIAVTALLWGSVATYLLLLS